MPKAFIQPMFEGQLDIIGDIHGEIDALNQLLSKLGYAADGVHPDGRKIIFVGDLCDRGSDSLAVITKVKSLVEAGLAQCVLGNHELNLLIDARREGNGWFFGSPHEDDRKNFQSIAASAEDQVWILSFLDTLPLVLASSSLRVVHACWDSKSIQRLQQLPSCSLAQAYQVYLDEIEQSLLQHGLSQAAAQEYQQYALQLKDPEHTPPYLSALAERDLLEQMQNPIKVVTSGAEHAVDVPFFVGGKWRFIDRLKWWDHYQDDIPVVMGHYWRNFKSTEEKTGLMKYIEPLAWFGAKKNIFCVDYSVGKRYLDRQYQRDYADQIAALRFPERLLMLEDGTLLDTE